MKRKIADISYIRLMLIYLLSCTVLLVLAVRSFNTISVSNNVKQIERMAGLLAEKMNESINHVVSNAQNTSRLLYCDEQITPEEVYENLLDSIEGTSYTSAGMYTEKGEFFGMEAEKEDLEKHGFANKARITGESYITEPYRSSITGRSVITIFEPVFWENESRGEIFLTFSIRELQKMASSEVLREESETFLINAYSGNYVYCNDGTTHKSGNWNNLKLIKSALKFAPGYSYETFIKNMRSGADKGVICFWIDGKKYTQAYISIKDMEGWYVGVRIENAKLSDSLKEYAVKITLYLVMLVVITVLLVYILLRKEADRKKDLEELSVIDPLTKVMNRRAFEECVKSYLTDEGESEGILVFVDVDNFKGINDKFGHAAGDIVLKAYAEAFRKCFRRTDFIGRFGGDEFIVFAKGAVPKTRIEEIFACLRTETRGIVISDTMKVNVYFSAGLARYPKDATGYEELCECADKALYSVKASGKNSFQWYEKL